jgi:hypothetical protein
MKRYDEFGNSEDSKCEGVDSNGKTYSLTGKTE